MIEPQRPSSATELEDLRERLERLEARSPKPRGRTGMRGAAEYIGRSKEWLRCSICADKVRLGCALARAAGRTAMTI
jgi:hypothetical protein